MKSEQQLPYKMWMDWKGTVRDFLDDRNVLDPV